MLQWSAIQLYEVATQIVHIIIAEINCQVVCKMTCTVQYSVGSNFALGHVHMYTVVKDGQQENRYQRIDLALQE